MHVTPAYVSIILKSNSAKIVRKRSVGAWKRLADLPGWYIGPLGEAGMGFRQWHIHIDLFFKTNGWLKFLDF